MWCSRRGDGGGSLSPESSPSLPPGSEAAEGNVCQRARPQIPGQQGCEGQREYHYQLLNQVHPMVASHQTRASNLVSLLIVQASHLKQNIYCLMFFFFFYQWEISSLIHKKLTLLLKVTSAIVIVLQSHMFVTGSDKNAGFTMRGFHIHSSQHFRHTAPSLWKCGLLQELRTFVFLRGPSSSSSQSANGEDVWYI